MVIEDSTRRNKSPKFSNSTKIRFIQKHILIFLITLLSNLSTKIIIEAAVSSGQNALNTNHQRPLIIERGGGIIRDSNVTLTKQFNPIVIKTDIIVHKKSKLTIGPGAEIFFAPTKGIIVYGTLEALGTPDERIRMDLLKSTQSSIVNRRSQNNANYKQFVRLVDGYTPNEGRVQVRFNNRWHSMCTNSKNLTSTDIKVLCNQLGYSEGQWYRWFEKRNESLQLMLQSPQCSGHESSINQCEQWSKARSGNGICDYHSDIGIRCTRKLFSGNNGAELTSDYWRGLEFINSETVSEFIMSERMRLKSSSSILSYVTISNAGANNVGNATGAIQALGQPPKMSNLEIKDSVYGIVVEDAEDAITISNIVITRNLGFPLFVNTSWGHVHLDRLYIHDNDGDGVRVVRHEKLVSGIVDFCKFANLREQQTYPLRLSHEQTFFETGQTCCQEFFCDHSAGQQLTIHFPVMRSTPNNIVSEDENIRKITVPKGVDIGKDAFFTIYDDYRDSNPFRVRITNNTRPQSLVSKFGRLKVCYDPAQYRTVVFTVDIVVDETKDFRNARSEDVEISNSAIMYNSGRGVWIQNPRSGLKVLNTTIIGHDYIGGLHLEDGSGDVLVNRSRIEDNVGHGIYINLAGGYYDINNSSIQKNFGRGVFIDFDENRELVAFNFTTHIGYSNISLNREEGVFIGNICRYDATWNISMNSFYSNQEDALVFQSCPLHEKYLRSQSMSLKQTTSLQSVENSNHIAQNQELTISHNIFRENLRRAIKISPVVNLKSLIRHNNFLNHPTSVLYVGNQYSTLRDQTSDAYPQTSAYIRIASNHFRDNRGRYVASLGVQEDNPKQSIVFTKNTLDGNVITEPYPDLNPRSRVHAVIVVSSSNTKIIRNRFNNPQSQYDLGSHLEMHSKVINATANFWGKGYNAGEIYKRIFDRKNRYNLAQVEFLQYLMSPEDLEFGNDLSFDRERDKITSFKNGNKIGGEVKGLEELNPGVYLVTDDIYVRPGSTLSLKPDTILKFADSTGMMVQGRLEASGNSANNIVLTSIVSGSRLPVRPQPPPAPKTEAWYSNDRRFNDEDDSLVTDFLYEANTYKNTSKEANENPSKLESKNMSKRQTLLKESPASMQTVRLSSNSQGRLEVQIDGAWGSVCDYNFDIEDAAVVCQQLGMVLNREDWLLERFQYVSLSSKGQQFAQLSTNVFMTNVRCDPSLDNDLTKCTAELFSRGDFDGTCAKEVGIKCYPLSWSGIRFGMMAETSNLEHVVIQRAGVFDYATYKLKPALQIDFNRHKLTHLTIKQNSDSGLGILRNDVLRMRLNEISHSKFTSNGRHGVVLKSPGLLLQSSNITNNKQNGIDYNPSSSYLDHKDILSWIESPNTPDSIVPVFMQANSVINYEIPTAPESFRYFILKRNPPANQNYSFTISTDPGHMLSLMIISPIHVLSTENITMTIGSNPESPVWDLRTNITAFPMINPGYKVQFNYQGGARPKGEVVIYVRSKYDSQAFKINGRNEVVDYWARSSHKTKVWFEDTNELNTILIANNIIKQNSRGLNFLHYNNFNGPGLSINHRYGNQTIGIINNLLDYNMDSAIFVGNHEIYGFDAEFLQMTSVPAEIHYKLLKNWIKRDQGGIKQFGRDIRNSYNIYHWTINETLYELNKGGGIDIRLPYYWRYDINCSHTVQINSNNFSKNSMFGLQVDGHFAVLNLTGNTFKDNSCKSELIKINGMEKKMLIRNNIIESNSCDRIIDFDIQSHADKLGLVNASFGFNSMRQNRRSSRSIQDNINISSNQTKFYRYDSKRYPNDFALRIKGVQNFEINRNVMKNPELSYELVLGIIMDGNEKTVDVSRNFWGTSNIGEIYDRIFDFDDWNNRPIAVISPFLIDESTSAAISSLNSNKKSFNLDRIGGRLTRSLNLTARKEPYMVVSDLTIMPGVTLLIDKGVILEFFPNVGILVLGELIAGGTRERPILMRPIQTMMSSPVMTQVSKQQLFYDSLIISQNSVQSPDQLNPANSHSLKFLQSAYPIDLGGVRLCKNDSCDQSLGERKSDNNRHIDGFLEVFNQTTLQWVPACDARFTERNAKVVCRQLGYTHLALFKQSRRYGVEPEQISSIKHWPEPLQCEGNEQNLADCEVRLNGYGNHSHACTHDGYQYIYIYCQDFTIKRSDSNVGLVAKTSAIPIDLTNNWGGIRFSCPSNDQTSFYSNDAYKQKSSSFVTSRMQYVLIDRGGMLHKERSPAIQIFQCNVQLEYINIENCAHHGIEVLAASGNLNFFNLKILNNLGVGINYLSLIGASTMSPVIPYQPLKIADLSHDIFGLVDICGANKHIHIEERILIFYKYDNRAIDCMKIVTSKDNVKHIGIRLLQFNLFNSTSYSTIPDYMKIYDGNIFDIESRLLVDLGVTEKHRRDRPEMRFYHTSDHTMTIRLHASAANHDYGFIAEIVTTPISYLIERSSYNNLTFSEISNNKLGAISVYNAGESSPNIVMKQNRIDSNCVHMFGNFTSCLSAIMMDLQNCQHLIFTNNLVQNNQGALLLKANSHTSPSALEAIIENNVFESNLNNGALVIVGQRYGSYQKAEVKYNIITRNKSPYQSNIILSRIPNCVFSSNILTSNIGWHQIEVLGFGKLPFLYQNFQSNWVYNNTATQDLDKSTIFLGSVGPHLDNNYFVNPDNHFEMSTLNWSKYDVIPRGSPKEDELIHLAAGDGSSRDVYRKVAENIPLNIIDTKNINLQNASIDAKGNYWGFNNTNSIRGRIRDRSQYDQLIRVDFEPFLEKNSSVLSGVCAGGWSQVGQACLVYVGARMTYQEAKDFCDKEQSSMPVIRGNHLEYTTFIRQQEKDFDSRISRVWIQSFEVPFEECPALYDMRTRNFNCQERHTFLCEKNPHVKVSLVDWHKEPLGFAAISLILFTLLLVCSCMTCWIFKSTQRRKEKLERHNSILRASIRSRGYSSSNSLNELMYRRQYYNNDKSSFTDLSLSTQLTPQSIESSNLIRLDPSASLNGGHVNRQFDLSNSQDYLRSISRQSSLVDQSNNLSAYQAHSINGSLPNPENSSIGDRSASRSHQRTGQPTIKNSYELTYNTVEERRSAQSRFSNDYPQNQVIKESQYNNYINNNDDSEYTLDHEKRVMNNRNPFIKQNYQKLKKPSPPPSIAKEQINLASVKRKGRSNKNFSQYNQTKNSNFGTQEQVSNGADHFDNYYSNDQQANRLQSSSFGSLRNHNNIASQGVDLIRNVLPSDNERPDDYVVQPQISQAYNSRDINSRMYDDMDGSNVMRPQPETVNISSSKNLATADDSWPSNGHKLQRRVSVNQRLESHQYRQETDLDYQVYRNLVNAPNMNQDTYLPSFGTISNQQPFQHDGYASNMTHPTYATQSLDDQESDFNHLLRNASNNGYSNDRSHKISDDFETKNTSTGTMSTFSTATTSTVTHQSNVNAANMKKFLETSLDEDEDHATTIATMSAFGDSPRSSITNLTAAESKGGSRMYLETSLDNHSFTNEYERR